MNTLFLLLLLASFIALIVLLPIVVVKAIQKKKSKISFRNMGIAIVVTFVSIIGFTVTLDNEELESDSAAIETSAPTIAEDVTNETDEKPVVEAKKPWNESLEEIINSSDAPSDKFYALEKVMMDAEVAESDIESFKNDILTAYKEKTYIADPTNDSVMLNYIFKSYIVEQNETDSWNDFAFDFHQNVKYVYRGVDGPESEAVKANEAQMDNVINNL